MHLHIFYWKFKYFYLKRQNGARMPEIKSVSGHWYIYLCILYILLIFKYEYLNSFNTKKIYIYIFFYIESSNTRT